MSLRSRGKTAAPCPPCCHWTGYATFSLLACEKQRSSAVIFLGSTHFVFSADAVPEVPVKAVKPAEAVLAVGGGSANQKAVAVPVSPAQPGKPMAAVPTKATVPVSPPASALSPSAPASVEAPRKKAEKLRFQFSYAPWKVVLDWFAKQADLSLMMDTVPPGTFNYSGTHEFTPGEAIDLLNSILIIKNFVLVRRDRMLMVLPYDETWSNYSYLVPTVPVESLEGKGESEMVNVIFNLKKIRPEDTEAEVRNLLGLHGSVVSLPKSQQLSVTDTVGRVRTVRDYLKRIETEGLSGLKIIQLKNRRPKKSCPFSTSCWRFPTARTSRPTIRSASSRRAGRSDC